MNPIEPYPKEQVPPKGDIMLVLDDGTEVKGWCCTITGIYYALGELATTSVDARVVGWRLL